MKLLMMGLLLSASIAQALPVLRSEYSVEGRTKDPRWPFRVPEGITFDESSHQFFVTSLHGGTITRIDAASGTERLFYQETQNQDLSFAGLKSDSQRRRLWVCSFDKKSAQVLLFNSDSGRLERSFPLPMPFLCNDIALDLNDGVFVSNSSGDVIMHISGPDREARVFAKGPMLLPLPKLPVKIGPNGMAVTPDGRFLLVAISVPARIARIRISDPKDISYVRFSGEASGIDPIPKKHYLSFLAPDGMAFHQEDLLVCYHGAVQRLIFSRDDYSEAIAISTRDVPSGLSTLTTAYDEIFVIDSEILTATLVPFRPLVRLPNKIIRVKL